MCGANAKTKVQISLAWRSCEAVETPSGLKITSLQNSFFWSNCGRRKIYGKLSQSCSDAFGVEYFENFCGAFRPQDVSQILLVFGKQVFAPSSIRLNEFRDFELVWIFKNFRAKVELYSFGPGQEYVRCEKQISA